MVLFEHLCPQVTVPTTRREDGGITPALIPTWMACGTVVVITAAVTRTESIGPSSEEDLILLRKSPWWYDPMQTPSINAAVTHNWTQDISNKGILFLYHKKKLQFTFFFSYCIFRTWLMQRQNKAQAEDCDFIPHSSVLLILFGLICSESNPYCAN